MHTFNTLLTLLNDIELIIVHFFKHFFFSFYIHDKHFLRRNRLKNNCFIFGCYKKLRFNIACL